MISQAGATRAPAEGARGSAGGVAGGGASAASAASAATGLPRRGFTLIELLVVIMIIGILASIIMPVLGRAKIKAMREWARKETIELGSALDLYHQNHGAYPPDTDDWGSVGGNPDFVVSDRWSLCRYLGTEIVDDAGARYQAYYGMKSDRYERSTLKADSDGNTLGVFLDPFRTPYELDAMHMVPPNSPFGSTDDKTWRQSGWPYSQAQLDGASGLPTEPEVQRMTLGYKLISKGPDQLSAGFPFDPDPADANYKYVGDDIRPW